MNRTPVADWQQLSALYELADTLAPDALGDWLGRLRQEAHPLLAQLEQMLAARSQIQRNGFLGALPHLPAPPEPRVITWQAGSRIGPYRLLRKIGTGGMAEVWLAQRDDGAFQRQVAIKLLFRHAGSDALDTFAQRFDRERDILASLDHPHIAGLHDAGVTPNGQPWLALEYVEGQTLTSWCDARCLTIEARVRLFRQVLLAVQHAHANLVIHRDLKPGNILVTADGEVRLLDFGIAKLMEPDGGALAETELTRLAGRPMTVNYASPEQLMGQPLTTACDVYSLGVVLYELLCGERPYELKVESTAQLEQAILDTEPRAPSRRALAESTAMARGTTGPLLRKQLASDLDAIVLRALAKQPAQRYGSVEALGADLDRWLDGEPVEARAPSTVYRVGKFVRRHVLSVSLGVGAIASLIAVAAVAVVMSLQAREDSARAVAARDFMLNIFQRADQEKSRGADITARDLLETGRKDVLARLVGQPKLQAELLKGIAKIQGDMGEYVTADSTFAELVRACAESQQPREEAMARADHAFNALQMNNLPLATRLLSSAEAVPKRPIDDAELNARLGEVKAFVELGSGNALGARDLLLTARRVALSRLGSENLRTFRLGQALVRANRDIRDFNAAIVLQDELRRSVSHVQGMNEREIAAMEWERVGLHAAAGHFADALAIVDATLPRCIEIRGPEDEACRNLLVTQGQILLRLGKFDRGIEAIPRLKAISDDAAAPILQAEAMFLQFRLQSRVFGSIGGSALSERVRAFGQSGPEVAMKPSFKAAALFSLAEASLLFGDAKQAQAWVEGGLALFGDSKLHGWTARIAAVGRMLLGIALLQQGMPDQALVSLDNAQKTFRTEYGEYHPTTLLFGLNRALALARLNRVSEALAVVREAEPVLRDALGSDSPIYQQVRTLGERLGRAMTASPSDTFLLQPDDHATGMPLKAVQPFFS